MSIEAMKLALDALVKISKTEYHMERPPIESLEEKMRHIAKSSIPALRQAIAEAEQAQPVADVRSYEYSGVAKNGAFYEAVLREGAKVSEGDKLYTTPAQRKPLTYEEIDAAWRTCDYTVPWEQHRIDIARAIEAAHGIKENT